MREKTKVAPSISPEAQEQKLINKAYKLAEKQLQEGTASSSVICHFLKLATEKTRLENEKIEHENRLLAAKRSVIEKDESAAEKYDEVMNALKRYSGQGHSDKDEML